MKNKRSPGHGFEAFFAGKGFYIVLSLCVVVIGVSAWAMMSRAGTDVEDMANNDWTDTEAYSAAEYTDGTLPEPPVVESGSILQQESEAAQPQSQTREDNTPVELPTPQEEAAPVWSETPGDIETQQAFYWPVNGEVETPYSVDALVYNRTLSDWRTHNGIDIAAELGAQVMAAGSGRVERIYTDDLYGVTVVIDHMGGLKSIYSNLAETPAVYVGDGIIAGEIIGAVGSSALGETGEVTHLHFAMTLDGESVDPAEYLP